MHNIGTWYVQYWHMEMPPVWFSLDEMPSTVGFQAGFPFVLSVAKPTRWIGTKNEPTEHFFFVQVWIHITIYTYEKRLKPSEPHQFLSKPKIKFIIATSCSALVCKWDTPRYGSCSYKQTTTFCPYKCDLKIKPQRLVSISLIFANGWRQRPCILLLLLLLLPRRRSI